MYPVSPTAYDRAITVFSPDGRLFQVEYAREAVKRGTTALGMIYKDGVLLAADKNITSTLVKADSVEKIFQIDEHIAVATSGLVADARKLIEYARYEAQRERLIYGNPIDVSTLTRRICDLKQSYTQWGGTRPFGVSLLVCGVDESSKLFDTDPSGAYNELYAGAIGEGKKVVEALFEKEYTKELGLEEAVKLAFKALSMVGDKKVSPETVELAYISEKSKKFVKFDPNKLEKYMKRK